MSLRELCDRCNETFAALGKAAEEARVKMVELCNTLNNYKKENELMLGKFKNCLDVEYTHVENDGSYATRRDGDKLYIYFEKSNGKLDWKNNFTFPAKPYRKMKNLWFCHRGFLKVWKSIEPYIADEILDPEVKEIEIVGYSHGGAIAQLCYEYVKYNRPEITVHGYGFAAPRVFWGFARKAVRKRFEGFVVIRNSRDLITHLPPVLFGFHHIAGVWTIGEKSAGLIKDHYPDRYIEALEAECVVEVPTVEGSDEAC